MPRGQGLRVLGAEGADARQIQGEIDRIWRGIRSSAATRKVAAKQGIDVAIFDKPDAPFAAKRPGNQFDVATGVVVWFAGVAAGRMIGKGVDWLWDDVFWPRVRRKFGNKVKKNAERTAQKKSGTKSKASATR